MPEEKSFTWNPEEYSRSSSSQFLWANELLAKLNLSGSENILDVGCGDGRITAQISKSVPTGSVVGIDSSKEMIEYAAKNFHKGEYPNLRFEVMGAEEIKLPEKFNLAFSNAVLHWVKDHEKVLKGVANVLNSGGRLIISCGGKGNASDVMNVVTSLTTSDEWGKYFSRDFTPYHFYGTEEYKSWLRESNFEYSKLELVPKDMQHKSIDDFSGWIRTTWLPYTQQIPEELREKFIGEIVENYLKSMPADKKGIVHVKMVRLEVDAVKK